MSEKTKSYHNVKFPLEVLETAEKLFREQIGQDCKVTINRWEIKHQDETWTFDTLDDFYVGYGKEISEATWHEAVTCEGKQGIPSSFHVSYNHSFGEELTLIAVLLPSRAAIERVFNVFEDNYDKYKTAPEPTSAPTPDATSTYTIKRPLPSCSVERKLLYDLEGYIKRRMEQYQSSHYSSRYEVIIIDPIGTEKLKSIEHFPLSYFPDDIQGIILRSGFLIGSQISVEFDVERRDSYLEISFTGSSARQVVEGIAAEIFQMLQGYKIGNGFFHPSFVLGFVIDMTSWFMLFLITVTMIRSAELTIALFILFVAIRFYLWFRRSKPYSVFETRKNKKLETWNNWLVFTTLEFILFTVIGGLILKTLFNW